MHRVKRVVPRLDRSYFRPGLKARGHDLMVHDSLAAYVESMDEAVAEILDDVFGPGEQEDEVEVAETAEELRQMRQEAEQRLRERWREVDDE